MRKNLTFIMLYLFLLIGCSEQSTPQTGELHSVRETGLRVKAEIPAGFFPSDIAVMSVGDSLTKGVGDITEGGGYIPYLKEMLEQEQGVNEAVFTNFGVPGNRSEELLERLQTKEMMDAVQDTDLVIVSIGGNDVMHVVQENFDRLTLADFQKEKEVYAQNLDQIIQAIHKDKPNRTILILGLYNPFLQWFSDIREIDLIVDNWNGTSAEIAASYPGTYFVDIADIFNRGNENLLHTDYFHPNNKGYQLIAEHIYEKIKNEALEQVLESASQSAEGGIGNE